MQTQNSGESAKNGGPMLVLCLLLGVFGAHRFYAGKARSAVLQLVTLGGLRTQRDFGCVVDRRLFTRRL